VFAAIAAYESAYLIANDKNPVDGDGYPWPDVSEQEALDCGFVDNDCVLGGWHEPVLMYLLTEGEVSGHTYPYHAMKGFCTTKLSNRPYSVLNWGYVADGSSPRTVLPTDASLKQAIMKYGPIASAVITKGWDKYYKKTSDGTPNPNWSSSFPNGVFRGTPNSQCKVEDIDHEVAVVGWDDAEGVWLIKNSWDTSWGDEGFMKLSYGSNFLGYGSSWVQVQPDGSVSPTLQNRIRSINNESPLLHFYPEMKAKKA
jgi:hypothetical protein